MSKSQVLARTFKIKQAVIEDPNPHLPLADAVRALTANYPVLRHTQVLEEDGVLSEDGKAIVYEVVLPPVKTQG